MRKLYLLLFIYIIVALATFSASAQSNYNVFQVDNAPYADLTGDTQLPLEYAGTDPYELKELFGETFNFYGKQWLIDTLIKGIQIFPNGLIEVIEPDSFIICDGMLRQLDSIDVTSKISYKIEGVSGNKIIKVQWKNLHIRSGGTVNFANLQIWLYQEDGTVEYRYGTASANNASGFTKLNGPAVGLSFSDYNFIKFREKIWIYDTPPNIKIDSAHNINFPNISGVPVEGTVYRFKPRSSLSVASTNINDAVQVYPIPADKEVIIKRDKAVDAATVLLMDMNGKILRSYTLKQGEERVSITTTQLASGTYNIQMKSGNTSLNYKVTIAH